MLRNAPRSAQKRSRAVPFLENAEIAVTVTGDRSMRKLNLNYRGKDRTTDVLSFPLCPEDPEQAQRVHGTVPLGDIVINASQAERQAAENGETFGNEIRRLTIHGLLHLLGFDHEKSPAEAAAMRRLELKLMKKGKT